MTIEITCPNCNFSKTLPRDKLPAKARFATCPKCKQRFEFAVTEPVLPPVQAQEEEIRDKEKIRVSSPWENRSELGLWQGIYQTFKAVLFSPEKFFKQITYEDGIREPLAFGLLVGSIGTMFGIFWQFLMMSGGLLFSNHGFFSHFTYGIIFLGAMIFSPVFILINIFLISCITHVMLLITRGGKNGFRATFRVTAYGQAVQVMGAIPFIGEIIGFFWFVIVQIIGLREMHETSYLRIIIALLIPLVMLVFLAVAIVAFIFIFGLR